MPTARDPIVRPKKKVVRVKPAPKGFQNLVSPSGPLMKPQPVAKKAVPVKKKNDHNPDPLPGLLHPHQGKGLNGSFLKGLGKVGEVVGEVASRPLHAVAEAEHRALKGISSPKGPKALDVAGGLVAGLRGKSKADFGTVLKDVGVPRGRVRGIASEVGNFVGDPSNFVPPLKGAAALGMVAKTGKGLKYEEWAAQRAEILGAAKAHRRHMEKAIEAGKRAKPDLKTLDTKTVNDHPAWLHQARNNMSSKRTTPPWFSIIKPDTSKTHESQIAAGLYVADSKRLPGYFDPTGDEFAAAHEGGPMVGGKVKARRVMNLDHPKPEDLRAFAADLEDALRQLGVPAREARLPLGEARASREPGRYVWSEAKIKARRQDAGIHDLQKALQKSHSWDGLATHMDMLKNERGRSGYGYSGHVAAYKLKAAQSIREQQMTDAERTAFWGHRRPTSRRAIQLVLFNPQERKDLIKLKPLFQNPNDYEKLIEGWSMGERHAVAVVKMLLGKK